VYLLFHYIEGVVMADEAKDDAIVVTSMNDVDELFEELSALAIEEEARLEAKKESDKAHAAALAPIKARQAAIREAIAGYIHPRRRHILRRHGRTIKRDHGLIKYRVIGRSLDTPKNEKPIVAALLAMRGGKRYLTVTYTLNRDALAAANPSVMSKLRRFGVWAGRHENLSIQADGEAKPTVVRHNRFPRLK
jgi:hypothetical protein